MHRLSLPGIPWSRGEKEHDVAVDEGGASDAPDRRLGSYGGDGRDHHRRHPASKPDDYRHTRRRRLPSRIPRQELTLHRRPGKIDDGAAARAVCFSTLRTPQLRLSRGMSGLLICQRTRSSH